MSGKMGDRESNWQQYTSIVILIDINLHSYLSNNELIQVINRLTHQ